MERDVPKVKETGSPVSYIVPQLRDNVGRTGTTKPVWLSFALLFCCFVVPCLKDPLKGTYFQQDVIIEKYNKSGTVTFWD